MRCPRCDYDNPDHAPFCVQCGATLGDQKPSSDTYSQAGSEQPAYTEASIYGSYAEQYQPASPPPLNGHNRILPEPPSPSHNELVTDSYDESFGRQSQIYGDFKVHDERARWTIGRVIRSIVYFIAVAFSAFWLIGIFVEIDARGPLPIIAFFVGIVMMIGGIVVFVRLWRRVPRLSFSRFLLYALAATALASIALFIEMGVYPDLSKNIVASAILSMILMLYCLAVAMLALW